MVPSPQASPLFWSEALESFRGKFSTEIFNTWFGPLGFDAHRDGVVYLTAPNEFVAIWIRDNYLGLLKEELSRRLGASCEILINVVVDHSAPEPAEVSVNSDRQELLTPFRDAADSRDERRLDGLNPKNTFDNFVIGNTNQLAHAASFAVSNAPAKAYNPLFLYGDTGLGKTHLMHAIAHRVLEANPRAKVAYISTERFTNKFIRAIQENQLVRFRRFFRKVDILLIDDVQFLAGKERIQEEFFHTFNELYENQKQIVLSSDRPAGEIARMESRLVSRFQWGLMADIQAPDIETRIAILSKKAGELGIELGDEICTFLASNISRNVRQMEGALTRLLGYATLIRGPLSVDAARPLLKDILDEEMKNRVTIDRIQEKTAQYFSVSVSELKGRSKPSRIVVPRHIAMFLCRSLTSHSLKQIGESFGGRDHGTVIHAIRSVENLIDQDESINRSVEYLTRTLTREN